MSQASWRKLPQADIIKKLQRNSRGIVKLYSAQERLHDFVEHSEEIAGLLFTLIQERRNLRAELENRLAEQRKNQEVQP